LSSIRKKNGKYQVQIRRRGFKYQSASFTSLTDARRWARDVEQKIERSLYMPTEQPIAPGRQLSEIFKIYCCEASPLKLRGENDASILRAFAATGIDQLNSSEIVAADLSHHARKRLENCRPSTIQRELGLLRTALRYVARMHSVAVNPSALEPIALPRSIQRSRRLSEHELQRLYAALGKDDNMAFRRFVLLALDTGARLSELLASDWSDVNFSHRTIFIRHSKNGEQRSVVFSRATRWILESTHQRNGPLVGISLSTIRRRWEPLLKRAEIANLRIHDLRHEAISSWIERGLSLPETQLISGHKSIRMLERYTHLSAEKISKKLN